MEKSAPKFEKYIMVCVNQKAQGEACCGGPGLAIRDQLKAYVKSKKLSGRIRVSQTGCLDVCALGPNVLVYPENVWYRKVSAEDIPRIIEEQIKPLESAAK